MPVALGAVIVVPVKGEDGLSARRMNQSTCCVLLAGGPWRARRVSAIHSGSAAAIARYGVSRWRSPPPVTECLTTFAMWASRGRGRRRARRRVEETEVRCDDQG